MISDMILEAGQMSQNLRGSDSVVPSEMDQMGSSLDKKRKCDISGPGNTRNDPSISQR